MRWSEKELKELKIYVLIAYGVTFLMGGVMGYAYYRGADVGLFPNAQMMYPAAGVMLAYLVVQRGDEKLPAKFYYMYLGVTVLMILCTLASVLAPEAGSAGVGLNIWFVAGQCIMIGGSILFFLVLLAEPREKREAYGLNSKNGKASAGCVTLFVLIYFMRTAIAYVMEGQTGLLEIILTDYRTWIALAALALNFFLAGIAFFGEEYGWRYYLQPLLQKHYGKRRGVILLGIVWGLWHLPVNFFYYSPKTGLISAAAQQITCITLGIFFAYAYMKTENIWVPVVLHFLNNNLIPILSGIAGTDAIRNQSLAWGDLLPALVMNGLCFGFFLLAKVFRREV